MEGGHERAGYVLTGKGKKKSLKKQKREEQGVESRTTSSKKKGASAPRGSINSEEGRKTRTKSRKNSKRWQFKQPLKHTGRERRPHWEGEYREFNNGLEADAASIGVLGEGGLVRHLAFR